MLRAAHSIYAEPAGELKGALAVGPAAVVVIATFAVGRKGCRPGALWPTQMADALALIHQTNLVGGAGHNTIADAVRDQLITTFTNGVTT